MHECSQLLSLSLQAKYNSGAVHSLGIFFYFIFLLDLTRDMGERRRKSRAVETGWWSKVFDWGSQWGESFQEQLPLCLGKAEVQMGFFNTLAVPAEIYENYDDKTEGKY